MILTSQTILGVLFSLWFIDWIFEFPKFLENSLHLFSMGARKQRWSEEEESALKAGIDKHGAGKWTTILKDPEFKSVLCSRSNVDLKDKYRNMIVVRNGEGSREKTIAAPKRSKQSLMQDDNQTTLMNNHDDSINDVKLPMKSTDSFGLSRQNQQKSSLELLILEAIACLKENGGSYLASIVSYIMDNYKVPDSRKAIGESLKSLTEAGKLVKVNNRFKLAQNADFSKGRSSKVKAIENRQIESVKSDGDLKMIIKSSKNVRLLSSDGDLKNVSKSLKSEGLPKPNGDVSVDIRSDNEGLPTYKDRTAHEAAEAVAKAEIAKAQYEEAVKQLKMAESFVFASRSLLEKLDFQMSRRNASMKAADMQLE